jgi:hypothetical protein
MQHFIGGCHHPYNTLLVVLIIHATLYWWLSSSIQHFIGRSHHPYKTLLVVVIIHATLYPRDRRQKVITKSSDT